MKKFFAVTALALAFVASAFAQKPTVTDFQMVPGGPFTRYWRRPVQLLLQPYNYQSRRKTGCRSR